MARKPEIGNVALYPDRPLNKSDRNGYVLKFYCPIRRKRVRKNCGTRDRTEARGILRECRTRLINGEYERSNGAITAADESRTAPAPTPEGMTWPTALKAYLQEHRQEFRPKSHRDAVSRLGIAERIFAARHKQQGKRGDLLLADCVTIEALTFLRSELLAGAEPRKRKAATDETLTPRSPNTVNSMMATVMPFIEFCGAQVGWIPEVKRIKKLKVDDPMKGRPITGEEFDRLVAATPLIVGKGSAESWVFCLRVLWESAFRIQDLMEFSWDDPNFINPVWPKRAGEHPTIVIPPSQKNGKWDEVPMLPGLVQLLGTVPEPDRVGWIVNPRPVEFVTKAQKNWFMPNDDDLAGLIPIYTNKAIANACGVSDVTVGEWIRKRGLSRVGKPGFYAIPDTLARRLRANAAQENAKIIVRSGRLTPEHVSKIIAKIGEQASVVVKAPKKGELGKVKYASAHDLRRGIAHRLINAGVSAETLTVLMRHRDFATTEKFYGAKRQAQAAAAEIAQRVGGQPPKIELVGGLVGGLR
jgi:integrase